MKIIKYVILSILLINTGALYMHNHKELLLPNTQGAEIYPMPVFCTLTVSNVQKSADWYVKALGFSVIFEIQDPVTKESTLVHLRRAKYQDILLKPAAATDQAKNSYGIAVTFQAWSDIDALTKLAKQQGVRVIIEPHDTAWQTRDVTFQDIDGYQITFTYPNQELLQKITTVDPSLLNQQEWGKK